MTRGYLGVNIQSITPELAKALNLRDQKGALVADVFPAGPADKAGIKRGDVIIAYNGKVVPDSQSLPVMVAATPGGPGKLRLPSTARGRRCSSPSELGNYRHQELTMATLPVPCSRPRKSGACNCAILTLRSRRNFASRLIREWWSSASNQARWPLSQGFTRAMLFWK